MTSVAICKSQLNSICLNHQLLGTNLVAQTDTSTNTIYHGHASLCIRDGDIYKTKEAHKCHKATSKKDDPKHKEAKQKNLSGLPSLALTAFPNIILWIPLSLITQALTWQMLVLPLCWLYGHFSCSSPNLWLAPGAGMIVPASTSSCLI